MLVKEIISTVLPSSWHTRGGPGRIVFSPEHDAIIVHHTFDGYEAVAHHIFHVYAKQGAATATQ